MAHPQYEYTYYSTIFILIVFVYFGRPSSPHYVLQYKMEANQLLTALFAVIRTSQLLMHVVRLVFLACYMQPIIGRDDTVL